MPLAPASMLSDSCKYKDVFLSITVNDASAGTEIVLARAIGDPPDLVINTEQSTALEPSMFAIIIVLIFNTLSEGHASISVVKVVVNAA